jgi:hypothetical protein
VLRYAALIYTVIGLYLRALYLCCALFFPLLQKAVHMHTFPDSLHSLGLFIAPIIVSSTLHWGIDRLLFDSELSLLQDIKSAQSLQSKQILERLDRLKKPSA